MMRVDVLRRPRAHARRLLITALLPLVLAGCSLAPRYARPAVPVPATWRAPGDEAARSVAELAWWELFQDETLQGLIRIALEENKDLKIAVARVAQARAQLGVTRAAQVPEITGGAAAGRERVSERAHRPLPAAVPPEEDVFETRLDLTFELDLWGRLRSATRAARAELLASEEARRTVTITLVGDVAQAYFELRALDLELEIGRRTLASRDDFLRIVRLRVQQGVATELDVRRAEGERAATAATIAGLARRIEETENRLSTLVGRNPGAIPRGRDLTAQPLPPAIPPGLPSALLERRPDIRQAEHQLVAANARIGEARAAFFPQISLTGMFGLESVALSDLFTGPARLWRLGPAMTLPIFDAGRNRARLAAAEARTEEAILTYRRAVEQAFREVEDALVAHRQAAEVRREQEVQHAAAERGLQLARLQYLNGTATYLDVLDAQRELFAVETELARTRREQLTAVVRVYKALGGGWAGTGPASATGVADAHGDAR
jgi:multidrug efflux system outer membrane protein